MVYLPIFEEFLGELRRELRATVIRNFFWNTLPLKILSEVRHKASGPTVVSFRFINTWPVGVSVDNNRIVVSHVMEIVRSYLLERKFGICRGHRWL